MAVAVGATLELEADVGSGAGVVVGGCGTAVAVGGTGVAVGSSDEHPTTNITAITTPAINSCGTNFIFLFTLFCFRFGVSPLDTQYQSYESKWETLFDWRVG